MNDIYNYRVIDSTKEGPGAVFTYKKFEVIQNKILDLINYDLKFSIHEHTSKENKKHCIEYTQTMQMLQTKERVLANKLKQMQHPWIEARTLFANDKSISLSWRERYIPKRNFLQKLFLWLKA